MEHRNKRLAPASIIIVGNGVLAYSAAIALRRALPAATIALASPACDDAYADDPSLVLPAAIPSLGLMGLDEPMLVSQGVASHRLCERFDGWGPAPFAIDHAIADRLQGAGRHHLWLAHGTTPYDALSPAVALAQAGRFTPLRKDGPDAALALSPRRLRDHLTALLARARIAHHELAAEGVVDGDSGMTRLRFAGGQEVTPDLVVLTTLPRSTRDRLVRVRERFLPAAPALFDSYGRTPAGWRARLTSPEGDREMIVDDAAHAAPIEASPGWRSADVWIRHGRPRSSMNLVSLAPSNDPFLRLGLSVGLLLLALLIDLLPSSPPEPLLIAEFDRRADAIRDQASAFARLLDRRNDDDPARGVLADILAQFEQNGRLPSRSIDLIGKESWAAALIGLGIRPAHADALAGSIPADRAQAALARLAAATRAAPRTFPVYSEWLRSVRGF
jgi:tryptophan halogenase